LCPFSFADYPEYLRFVIKGDVPLLFRNRLKCMIKYNMPKSLSCGLLEESNNSADFSDFQSSTSSSDSAQEVKMISLNEIVVGRGGSSFICNLELYVNNYLITTIQGDGVIISTPTGKKGSRLLLRKSY
jgi:NAD+ kinase